MNTADNSTNEVFSYHLVKLDFFSAIRFFIFPPHSNTVSGLKYSLCLFTMKPGISVFSFARYNFTTLALIAWWEHADWLDRFLESGKYPLSPSESWHIRIKPYRRWGSLKELNHAHLFKELMSPSGTVAALTLAKLKLSQTLRFTKWGKPVENQVDKHKGKKLAIVSMRPPQMFSTFSIWSSETEMLNMIEGNRETDGINHREAIKELSRRSFHHEFTTMRFQPLVETGKYEGQSCFSTSNNRSGSTK